MAVPPDTSGGPPPSAPSLAEGLARGAHPSADEVESLVAGVLDGTVPLDDFGRFLVALADAGETTAEIAGVAAALRARMVRVPHRRGTVADTCGTGGDGSGTFNISTAAAIVAAGAGLAVAKHGNRAVSSRTGSADVLERLGVRVDAPADVAAACLEEVGLCFCLAPVHHPAMARVGPLRRSLGRPTVFNLVGPLCNPAGATVQVIGVGRADVRAAMARAALACGARRVLVVSAPLDATGTRSLDEVSLFGPTDVIDVGPQGTTESRVTPEDFGLVTRPLEEMAALGVSGPEESAAAIRAVLSGERGPRRDVVVLNAAAVLFAAGLAESLPAARALAERSLDSGRAAATLAALAARSQAAPSGGARASGGTP